MLARNKPVVTRTSATSAKPPARAMPFAWKTAVTFFLCGLIVGSLYANLVFTHTDKAKASASSAAMLQHAGAEDHDTGLIVREPSQPATAAEPSRVTEATEPAVVTTARTTAASADPTPAGWPPKGPIPVWVWMDYKNLPGFIELNLRVLQHNAPSPRYEIRYVTPDTIRSLVPDMPPEFDRMPYAAATSDLIRTALIAHHGGVYLDTDFLVQRPLHEFTDELENADFVSYESHGQKCQKGQFSSNFVAGRPNNELYRRSWERIKELLKRRCMHKDGTPEQGVCCYTADGKPRKCHVQWAGVGERTSHPILEELLKESSGFRIACFNETRTFVPTMRSKNNPEFNSGMIAWTVVDGEVCRREGDDFLCASDKGGKNDGPWSGESRGYFNRLAYHLFASVSTKPWNRALSPAELLSGKWAISELYRGALGGKNPPPLEGVIANLPRMYDARSPAGPAVRPRVVVGDGGRCTETYSAWAGKPLNRSDDFECQTSDVTFVHVPKTAGTTIERLGRVNAGRIWGHDYDMKRWDHVKALPAEDRGSYPKVGTTNTSIGVCTGTCPCNKGCCWWHVPPKFLLDWRPYYLSPHRFCVVRNPFKRMLSQFSWLSSTHGVTGCPTTKEQLAKRDGWLQKHLRQFQRGEHWVGDCHFIPQEWYVQERVSKPWMDSLLEPPAAKGDALRRIRELAPTSDADAWQCNVVLRFENMTTDLEAFRTWTGVDVVPSYRKPYTSTCSNALSAETVRLIREVYAGDFERFGYSTEWLTASPE